VARRTVIDIPWNLIAGQPPKYRCRQGSGRPLLSDRSRFKALSGPHGSAPPGRRYGRRWITERAIAWRQSCLRLAARYERSVKTFEVPVPMA
jgi:hypothetical protein